MADLTKAQRARLPKSKLFWFRWWGLPLRLMRFRNANAAFVVIGPIEFGWRMPWLPNSARALHPEIFNEASQ